MVVTSVIKQGKQLGLRRFSLRSTAVKEVSDGGFRREAGRSGGDKKIGKN